jgi:hypothetical protein
MGNTIRFDSRIIIPERVLLRELDGESVLLNLDSERYFGLDETGTRMWAALTTSKSIEEALEKLVDEYDVESELLREDLNELIEKLRDHGLVDVSSD